MANNPPPEVDNFNSQHLMVPKENGNGEAVDLPNEHKCEEPEPESMLLRERKKRKKHQPQRKITSVYVTGLPQDITIDELNEHFKSCGMILPDLETNLPKIKIYEGPDGRPKGDALVIYLKEESVQLAETLLDDSAIRPGIKVGVQRATFSKKETFDPGAPNVDLNLQTKRKLRNIHKKLEWY